MAKKVVAAAQAGDLEAARLVLEFGLTSARADPAAVDSEALPPSNAGVI